MSGRFIRRSLLCLLACLAGGCVVPQSQHVAGRTGETTEPVTGRDYYVYLPVGYTATRKYPLVVSIHGMKPFDNAFPQLQTWRKICDDNGWIAIAPQLKSPDMLNQFPFRRVDSTILSDEALIVSAVQDAAARYSVDTRYVMLTGWSSGGYLIHYSAARHPELFTVVAPQGSNFSEDIMPQYLTDAAREMPVYIYHGSFDLPMVVKDCNNAAQWYLRHGYKTVKMDEAPGGHERHPELAARFFQTIIQTDRTGQIAARVTGGSAGGPWLGSAAPTRVAVAAPLTPVRTVTPTPAPTARPGETVAALPTVPVTPMVPPPPPGRVSNTPTPATVVTGPAPAPPPADRTGEPPGTVVTVGRPIEPDGSAWDRLGPRRPPADAARFVPLATPSPSPGPARVDPNQTSPIRPPTVSAVGPVAIAPTRRPTIDRTVAPTGVIADAPTTMPAEITPTRVASLPVGPAPSTIDPGRAGPPARAEGRLVDPARTDAKPVSADPVRPTLTVAVARPMMPGALPPADPLPPASDRSNPVSKLTLTSSEASTPSAAAAPQAVPTSSNLLSVRILPSLQQGAAPLTVEFRAEIRGVNAPITKYRWRLADSLFSTAHYGVLTFQQAGDYPIELSVTDAAGNTYRGRTTIRVAG